MMTDEHNFAGTHTALKIDIIAAYCESYLRALKNKASDKTKIFVDPFAGTGQIGGKTALPLLPGLEVPEALSGSAARALGLPQPFDRYLFSDKSPTKIARLEEFVRENFPLLVERVTYRVADANTVVQEFCCQTDWQQTRAVMFLDPFGNQVDWRTIEAIAAAKHVDMWYLFPSGDGVYRQLGGALKFAESSLDRIFGRTDWRAKLLRPHESSDLYDADRTILQRTVSPDKAARYFIGLLREVFGEGVLETTVPLGRNGRHAYALIFACSNHAGSIPAKRIAEGVIKHMERLYPGRPK